MSDNENNNKDLKPGGESSPPTEENPQTPHTDNDNDKDKSQSQETEGGEEPDVNNKEDENPNKENNNDLPDKIGNSVGKHLKKGWMLGKLQVIQEMTNP